MSRGGVAELSALLASRAPPAVVEGKRAGDEVEVRPCSPAQAVFIGGCKGAGCEGASIRVRWKAARVTVQGCVGCEVRVVGSVVAGLEIVGCEGCLVVLEEGEVGTVVLDQSRDTTLWLPAATNATDDGPPPTPFGLQRTQSNDLRRTASTDSTLAAPTFSGLRVYTANCSNTLLRPARQPAPGADPEAARRLRKRRRATNA